MKSGRQKNVRFPEWIHNEIERIANEKNESFTEIVNYMLEDELNHLGYTKANYDAERLNLCRDDHKMEGGQLKLLSEGGRKKKTG